MPNHPNRDRKTAPMPYAQRFAATLAALLLAFSLSVLPGCSSQATQAPIAADSLTLSEVPAYDGQPSVAINGNEPTFTEDELAAESFEYYSPLDSLGRCGTAFALIGDETLPTSERESISEVHPTGWQHSEYDFVDGKSLYNRCHLIAHKLAAENANERNLITGTRYLNTEGMLPYEDEVADYVYETGNHVLYRVTPLFQGDELVARGVHMEAQSVEDGGVGVSFNVYCFNVEPGVGIDYATGDNWLDETSAQGSDEASVSQESDMTSEEADAAQTSTEAADYVLNTKSRKFHTPKCDAVADISQSNRKDVNATRDELVAQGYTPCGACQP